MILEPKIIKSVTVFVVSPSICLEVMGPTSENVIHLHFSKDVYRILGWQFFSALGKYCFSTFWPPWFLLRSHLNHCSLYVIYCFPLAVLKIFFFVVLSILIMIDLDMDFSEIILFRVCWNSSSLATWCEELTHLKRPWCWENWRQEKKGMTEDEMVEWHHRFNGHEFG